MPERDATTWARAVAFSLAAHLAALGLLAGVSWWRDRRQAAPLEIDVSQPAAPRLPDFMRPHAAPQRRDWVAAKKGTLAPDRQDVTETAEADAAAVCPPPCPETAGAYLPGPLAATPPEMLDALDPDDYPKAAAKQGLEGRVAAELFIDADGKVREVRLTQKGAEVFNQWVLDRMRTRRFKPARDAQGNAIPVTWRQSFNFQLN